MKTILLFFILTFPLLAQSSWWVDINSLLKANNLSDVPNKATARTNLGAADTTLSNVDVDSSRIKLQINNVDNTSDANKPVSIAQQSAIDSLKYDAILEVGSNKEYTTIQSAITASSDDDLIKIYPGSYVENLTIDKKISLYGEGSNVYVLGKTIVQDTVQIKNITLKNNTLNTDTVVSIRNGRLEITQCNVLGIYAQYSGTADHNGGVLEGGTEIHGGNYSADLDSILTHTGTANQGIIIRNLANCVIKSKYANRGINANNQSTVKVFIDLMRASIGVNDSAVVELHNTHQRYYVWNVVKGGTLRMYNGSSIFADYPDTTTGRHNLEMSTGYDNNRIEVYNYYVEFKGYTDAGVFTLAGSPVEALQGELIIKNSTIINNNGGTRAIAGYAVAVKLSTKTKAELYNNNIVYKQDYAGYDGVGISFGKEDSVDMDIRIVNNVIQTDSNSAFGVGIRESALSGETLTANYSDLLDATDICVLSNNTWVNKGFSGRYITSNISCNFDSLYIAHAYHNSQSQTYVNNLHGFGEQNVFSGDNYFGSGGINLRGNGNKTLGAVKRRAIVDTLYTNPNTNNIYTDPTLANAGYLTGSGGTIIIPKKGSSTGISLQIKGRLEPLTSLDSDARIGGATKRFSVATINQLADGLRTTSAASDQYGLTDNTLFVDATADTVTIGCNPAWGSGVEFILKKIDSSANPVILNPDGAATIEGAATHTLTAQYQYIRFKSNGTNLFIVGGN